MNTELLLKVKEQILKEPRQFDMARYFVNNDDLQGEEVIPNCGTSACIAGWTIAIYHQVNPKEARHTTFRPGVLAANFLGIPIEEAEMLFYVVKWPKKFRQAYNTTSSKEQKAEITAERIDYFIQNGQ